MKLNNITATATTATEVKSSFFTGQTTFLTSCFTWSKNLYAFKFLNIVFIYPFIKWQERQASNPQPPVLETGALPIELHSYHILAIKVKRFIATFKATTCSASPESYQRYAEELERNY